MAGINLDQNQQATKEAPPDTEAADEVATSFHFCLPLPPQSVQVTVRTQGCGLPSGPIAVPVPWHS